MDGKNEQSFLCSVGDVGMLPLHVVHEIELHRNDGRTKGTIVQYSTTLFTHVTVQGHPRSVTLPAFATHVET